MNELPRRRILLFTNLFPNPGNLTHGIFILQLARELALYCDVTVVCPLPWFPRISWFRRFARWYALAEVPSRYQVENLTVFSPKYLMMPRFFRPFQAILVFLGSLTTVWRLQRANRFDVLHAPWLFPDAVAAGWLARRLTALRPEFWYTRKPNTSSTFHS